MKLIFPEKDVNHWASLYSYPRSDKQITKIVAPRVRKRGSYTKNEVQKVVAWKSPRSAHYLTAVDERFIEEITRYSIASKNERVKIEILQLIEGVSWPIASTLLHFVLPNNPIIDVRALWSLGITEKKYNFELWDEYKGTCQGLAKKLKIPVRTLDKALWQYSKSNQLVKLNVA